MLKFLRALADSYTVQEADDFRRAEQFAPEEARQMASVPPGRLAPA